MHLVAQLYTTHDGHVDVRNDARESGAPLDLLARTVLLSEPLLN